MFYIRSCFCLCNISACAIPCYIFCFSGCPTSTIYATSSCITPAQLVSSHCFHRPYVQQMVLTWTKRKGMANLQIGNYCPPSGSV